MKNCDESVLNEVVSSGDVALRRYCEWLIDAPTFGARLFAACALSWCSTEGAKDKEAFPETYAILERHFNEDPELMQLRKRLNITENRGETWN